MANLIKNYLPLRINLPSPLNPSISEETFAFVKPHVSSSSVLESSSRTLFISNVPFYPNIKSSILLKCLFERFGDVERVVVTQHPRKNFEDSNDNEGEATTSFEDMTSSMFKKEIRSIAGQQTSAVAATSGGGEAGGMTFDEYSWYNEGKFAHVIFSSSKVMKKVWNMIQKKNRNDEDGITFGRLEIQELEDMSHAQCQKDKKTFMKRQQANEGGGDEIDHDWGENDDAKDEEETVPKTRGITKLIEAKKASIPSRKTLKMICDQIMTKYEEAEEEALKQKEAAKDQPDDDGFVTVSYSTNVGDIVDMEQKGTLGSTGTAGGRKRKEDMRRGRSRTRSVRPNIIKGNTELADFYRFQLKESKKRNMEDLKNRFQEDLKRVKKMKQDKMYRPF